MNGNGSVPERARRRRYIPLLYRVAGVNVLLLVVAVAVTIIVLDPDRVSSFRVDAEGAALIVALLLVVAINVFLVRRLVGPVQALTALARRVDLSGHGERMPVSEPASEAGELASTFNEMLDRLEEERREATGRVLAGAGGRAAADRTGAARPGRAGADRGPARARAGRGPRPCGPA